MLELESLVQAARHETSTECFGWAGLKQEATVAHADDPKVRQGQPHLSGLPYRIVAWVRNLSDIDMWLGLCSTDSTNTRTARKLSSSVLTNCHSEQIPDTMSQ